MRDTQRWTLRLAGIGMAFMVALLATACAAGGPATQDDAGPAGAEGSTLLRVYNTDTAGQPLTVFILREAGTAERIGTVQPNEYLTVPHTAGQGRFQFRADRPDGTTIESPLFTIVSGTYTWDIALRRVNRTR